jgi:hypothetical protein
MFKPENGLGIMTLASTVLLIKRELEDPQSNFVSRYLKLQELWIYPRGNFMISSLSPLRVYTRKRNKCIYDQDVKTGVLAVNL